MGEEGTSILCRWTTQLGEEWQVNQGDMAVPGHVTRYELSQTINALLQAKHPRAFDFLVEGELLRGELRRHLEKRGTSVEKTINIEYFVASEPPEKWLDIPHPDWVSAALQVQGVILTGSYDGSLLIHTLKGKTIYSEVLHEAALSSIACVQVGEEDSTKENLEPIIITSAKDGSIKGWQVDDVHSEDTSVQQVFKFAGHTGSVESLASSPGVCRFCSAGWDKSIRVWSCEPEELKGLKDTTKRRKTSSRNVESVEALEQVELVCLRGHKQNISSVIWPESNTIYSASWDHTVMGWDVGKGVTTSNLIRDNAIFCLAGSHHTGHSASLSLVMGGPAKGVTVWDPREIPKDGSYASVKFLKSHKSVVSDVQWSPDSAFHFASCDYDGVVKVWDLRSPIPLHSFVAHEGKALCLEWFATHLASGGSDQKLSVQSIYVG